MTSPVQSFGRPLGTEHMINKSELLSCLCPPQKSQTRHANEAGSLKRLVFPYRNTFPDAVFRFQRCPLIFQV